MKSSIHPTWYPEAVVTCACGNKWTTGSTKKEIHTDVCSNCHPFFTGEQRIVDTAGQVERFMKRMSAKEQIASTQPAPEDKRAKKEKRRGHRTGMEEPAAPEAPPDELPLAVMEEPRREVEPEPGFVQVAPAGEVQELDDRPNIEVLEPGNIGQVASVDQVIEPVEVIEPEISETPETDEAPRGAERAIDGGTAEVADAVRDVEMPDKSAGDAGKAKAPRKRAAGPRKTAGGKPAESEPTNEG